MNFISFLKTFWNNIWQWSFKHKILAIFFVILIIGGGYYIYSNSAGTSAEIRYVLAAVQRGTLVTSVSGTGQVSASNQVEVKPKVSGEIVYIGIKNGDVVQQGQLIAQLDTADAEQAVKDAEISLNQTKLNLEKMKGLSTSEGSIRGDKEKATDDLAKAHEDGFNMVANVFLELPGIMSGLKDMLYAYTLGVSQWNIDYYFNAIQNVVRDGSYDSIAYRFREAVNVEYNEARMKYDANFSKYKSTSRFSDAATIEQLIIETYDTTQLIAESIKSANNLIQLYKDRLIENNVVPKTTADTHLSQLSNYTSKTNSYLTNLLSIKTTIQSKKESIINIGFNLADQEIVVAKAERVLAKAKDTLAECQIRAPFKGTIAKVSAKRGDSVSSGSSVVTLISMQRIAGITVNEIDVEKIKVGQNATLMFDAISDLTIVGKVTDVDTLGTVSQGVVSYTIQIAFSPENNSVKPGMSVSAAIITNIIPDVLLVPNSAIKTQGNNLYVETLENYTNASASGQSSKEVFSLTPPKQILIEVGISNDSETEIKSGINEGDLIVTRTTSVSATPTASTQSTSGSGIRIPGLGGMGR